MSHLRRNKRSSYKVKHNPVLTKNFPVGPCNANPYTFYCLPCSKSVSYSHQSLGDVNEHCRGVTHKKNEKAIKTTRGTISYHQGGGYNDLKKKTLGTEILHKNFLLQHNIPFLTADHLAPLYGKIFPKSKIVKNFTCSRTKKTAILNEAMKPAIKSELLNYMLQQPFALINDKSSDTGLNKMQRRI